MAVAVVIVGARAITYAGSPLKAPGNPDSAWYTWRSELLTAQEPGALISFDGPTGDGGGGYRVATPLLGALLRRIADVEVFGLPTLLVVGLNSLLALALGGVAYRLHRDPVLFGAVALWVGWVLLWNPFFGYMDNVLALLLLVAALSFLGDGRRGAGPVAIFVLLAFLAHPPATLGFVAAVVLAAMIPLLVSRSRRERSHQDAFGVTATLAGAAGGYLAWKIGAWGPGAEIQDAIHPSRLTQEAFSSRLSEWLSMLRPSVTIPLILLGVLGIVLLDPGRFKRDLVRRTMLLWLLPLLGILGVFTSYVYPYHRFLNVSAAPLLLAGIGLWVITRPFFRPRPAGSSGSGTVVVRALIGMSIAIALLGPAWASGLRAWNSQDASFASLRSVTAAIRAFLSDDQDPPPLVFIASSADDRSWTFRRGTSNRLRAGLPGPSITKAYTFLGSVEDFLDQRPTTQDPELAAASEGAFREMTQGVGQREPLVLMIRQWNRGLGNRSFFARAHSIQIERDLFVLTAPGLVQPDAASLASARRAGARARAEIEGTQSNAGGTSSLARAALGIALIAFLPGALACRYLARNDLVGFLSAAPALSLGLNLTVGFTVLALLRQPLTESTAWAIIGMANLLGLGLFLLSGRGRPRVDGVPTRSPRSEGAQLDVP